MSKSEFEKKIFGYEPIVLQLMQVADMCKNESVYEELGATLPKGILLYGEPGLGKSLLASCFSKETGRQTFLLRRNKNSRNFTDEITKTFAEAKMAAPSVIFCDDLDHFASDDDNDEEFNVVQGEIDDLGDADVIVIATANEYRRLPHSLRRSGRFDITIHVPAPEQKDAEKIIDFYLKDKAVGDDINVSDISKMLVGMSCSDLQDILNQAAIFAGYDRAKKIDMKYFVKAALLTRYDSLEGYDEISQEEKEKTALHEAGHICAAWVCQPGCIGMGSILVSGRGNKGGFVSRCEPTERRPHDVVASLAGKCAVELYYPGCASGAQSDLTRAMDDIRSGVCNSGTLGLANLDASNEQFPKTSDEYKNRNEAIVLSELERFMFITKKILIENRDFLEKLKAALVEKGTLLNSDIQAIADTCKIIPTEV